MSNTALGIRNQQPALNRDDLESGEFSKQEPPSIGSRPTPVVPLVAWPSDAQTDHPDQASQPTPETFEAVDESFWKDRASVTDSALRLSLPPTPPRSRVRSIGSKLLFATLFLGAVSLLAYEVSLLLSAKAAAPQVLPSSHR